MPRAEAAKTSVRETGRAAPASCSGRLREPSRTSGIMTSMPSLALRAGLVVVAFLARSSSPCAGTELPRSSLLSEGWLFQPDPLGLGDEQRWERPDLDRTGWRPVTVPMAWDHYDPVMDGYEGVGWYALRLPAPLAAPHALQRLRFGRANHRAKVWVDGHGVGFTNDFPTFFGPFGLVTCERRPKKAHGALRALWTGLATDR